MKDFTHPGIEEARVVVFWLVLLVLLVGVIGYAAKADHAARKAGKVLVPVKHGRGRRTTFVRMDRDELEQQKLDAVVEKQRQERAERQLDPGIPTIGRALGNVVRRRMR